MGKTFISYSRADSTFAQSIATALSERGFEVWIDVESIPSGMNWSNAIQEGLDTADAMLVIISPDSMASKNVQDEWQYFLDQEKTLIPVLLKQTKLHFQLHRIQYVDFQDTAFKSAIENLVKELEHKGIKATQLPASEEIASTIAGIAGVEQRKTSSTSYLLGIIILVLAVAVVVMILSATRDKPTEAIDYVALPIRDSVSFEGDLPYNFDIVFDLSNVAFQSPISLDDLGFYAR